MFNLRTISVPILHARKAFGNSPETGEFRLCSDTKKPGSERRPGFLSHMPPTNGFGSNGRFAF